MLVRFERGGQPHGWKSGKCDRAARNASAANYYFESEYIDKGISVRLVKFDDHVFPILIRDRPTGIDLRPVKDTSRVKAAFRCEKIPLSERLPWLKRLEVSIDEFLQCVG